MFHHIGVPGTLFGLIGDPPTSPSSIILLLSIFIASARRNSSCGVAVSFLAQALHWTEFASATEQMNVPPAVVRRHRSRHPPVPGGERGIPGARARRRKIADQRLELLRHPLLLRALLPLLLIANEMLPTGARSAAAL
jgi:hypothetical protein